MSRPGPVKLLVKNWKQSIIFTPIFAGALWYTYDYTVTNDVMQMSCRKAAFYGDERIKNPTSPVRHITVILNPVACKRKSKKLYTKWVEPLLHLSGIKVSLVETNSPNQAFDLMKIMSNCDGVAIVGGDGTVHEALNGLLSRADSVKAASNMPIAIIPAGQYNSIARYIHQNNMRYRNQKEFLIEATMRLVDSCTQKFDVIKINRLGESSNRAIEEERTIPQEERKDTSSPIYALRDLRYGLYQDNFYKVSGYHSYQTYIKPIWLRLQRAFGNSKKYPPPRIDSLTYTAPCDGCSMCYDKHRLHDNDESSKPQERGANWRWWSMMAPVKSSGPTEEEKRQLDASTRENPDCQRWVNVGNLDEVSDFRACMMGEKKVRMSIGRQREYTPSDVTEVQDIRLKLPQELDSAPSQSSQIDQTAQDKKADQENKPVQFLIDGQPTQARSVEITAIHKAVTVFTGPYKIIIPDKPDPKLRMLKR